MTSSTTHRSISIEPEPAETVRALVLNGLRAFNRQHAPPPGFAPLVLAARAGNEIIGGLVGETGWEWLHVELLWVSEPHRRQGVGLELLQAAEREAWQRGARHVFLDTLEFQARTFYERHGYVIFGIQENYPPGHTRFYLRRDLTPPGGDRHEREP
jgi:GNAT superfamily N-acetyltransferase